MIASKMNEIDPEVLRTDKLVKRYRKRAVVNGVSLSV